MVAMQVEQASNRIQLHPYGAGWLAGSSLAALDASRAATWAEPPPPSAPHLCTSAMDMDTSGILAPALAATADAALAAVAAPPSTMPPGPPEEELLSWSWSWW